MYNKAVRLIKPENMLTKYKYAVFAFAFILLLSSNPSTIALTGVITNPKLISFTGPQLNQINYVAYPDEGISELSPGHLIMGNELSLDVATYNTFAADSSLAEGAQPGFSDQGIYMNMLRPVTNDTNVRRGLLSMLDYSYFENTMLQGVAGLATPSILPCSLYAAACTNTKQKTAAENMYPYSLVAAIKYLKASASDLNPNSRLYEGNTSNIDCGVTSVATSGCPVLTWHVGSATGPIWTPNWIGRGSLNRHNIGVYVQSQAAKIGLDLSTGYTEYAAHSQSAIYVEDQEVASVIHDGVYNPKTGFNSAPVYNFTRATTAGQDTWDFYSYGYGYTGPALVTDAETFNSAYGSAETNAGLYYNKTMDKASNAVIYAKTLSAATKAAGLVSLYEMQNVPWINVYFTNTLFAVLINNWSGYADVPTQGPTSLSGLYYTLLNVHANCFPATCTNGGTINYGLASTIDYPSGLTPMAHFNSVYDADITGQIYEGPTIIGPTQFTSPGSYTAWMLSYNGKPVTSQSKTLAIKAKSFTGSVGPGGSNGFFMLQGTQAAAKIVKGQMFTLTFAPNIYFSDHVQMLAKDFNFSLYASDISCPATLPDVSTPYSCALAGPAGMIADQIVGDPSTSLTINVWMNSTTAFNAANIGVPIIPQHIFQYFNIDDAYNVANTFDTSMNYNATIQAANGCVSCVNTKAGAAPAWLLGLPNLEVGTGGFILRSWDGVGQTGQLLRNVNYYRANWSMNDTNNQVTKGSSYAFSQMITEWTYSKTACASSPDNVCQVPITTVTSATVTVISSSGKPGASYTITCNGSGQKPGQCSGSIGPFKTTGNIELQLTASYTYLGLARTWYQLTGILVHK